MTSRDPDLSRLDRAINAVFPRWGFRRAQSRRAMGILATIKPLTPNRGGGGNATAPKSLDETIPYGDRLKMVDLFDRQFLESPILAGMVDQFVRNVVPPQGLRPIPQTGDEDTNKLLSDRFTAYAEDCEARGHSLWDMQQVLLKSVMGHGDAGIFHGMGINGNQIQGIPAAKVGTPTKHSRHEGRMVHQGIYTGAGTMPRGLYTLPRDRYGIWKQEKARYISASRSWWFGKAEDFESYRGASAFLASYPMLQMATSIMQYKAMQVKMASVFGIAIKKDPSKKSPFNAIGSAAEEKASEETGTTRPDIQMFNGMGITLNANEDIEVIESKIAAGDFTEFVYLVARYVGLSCGLPLEFVMQDWSRSNYYGNRMAATLAMRAFMDWWKVPARLTRLVFAEQVNRWVMEGSVKLPSTLTGDPTKCLVTLPPPLEVDPEKAFKLWTAKIQSNLASEEDYARSVGDDLGRIIQSRQRSLKLQTDAKLPVIASITPGVKLLSDLEAETE